MEADKRLESIANALSIGNAQRHIFLCAEQSNPRCAPREQTSELWKHLKARLKDLNVTSPPPKWQGDMDHMPDPIAPGDGAVLRSKVDCLRICEQGCIAVVYPEGTWYAGLTIEKLDRIVDEHLVGGRPVEDLIFAIGYLGR